MATQSASSLIHDGSAVPLATPKAELVAMPCPLLRWYPPCCGPPKDKGKWQLTATGGFVPLDLSTDKWFHLLALGNRIDWGDCVFFFPLGLITERASPPLIFSWPGLGSFVPCPKKLLFSRHRENDVYKTESTGIFIPLCL